MLFGLLIIVFKFKKQSKLQYNRYKYLNDNKDIEVKMEIAKEKVKVFSSEEKQKSYDFEKIIEFIGTKNLFILKLDYNMGISIAKNSLEVGTKEELLEYLYSQSVDKDQYSEQIKASFICYNIVTI